MATPHIFFFLTIFKTGICSVLRNKKITSITLLVNAILGFLLSPSALALDSISPFTCNGDYYISQSEKLFRVNTSNPIYKFDEIALSSAVTTNSLAFNFQDGYFYAIQNSGQYGAEPQYPHLIRMGQDTMEDLGEMVDMAGLPVTTSFNKGTFDLEGNYYVMQSGFTGKESLWKIDLKVKDDKDSIGVDVIKAVKLGDNIGFRGSDIAYHKRQNKIYSTVHIIGDTYDDTLYTYDLKSKTTTKKKISYLYGQRPTGNQSHFGSLWFDGADRLFMANNKSGNMYRIDDLDNPTAYFVSEGEPSGNNDGASCGGSPNFTHTISPSNVPVGTKIVSHSYSIANGLLTSIAMGNPLAIGFNDVLSDGRTFVADSLRINGANTGWQSNISSTYTNNDSLTITNLDIPAEGTALITIDVTVQHLAAGTYENQAKLTDLVAFLGGKGPDLVKLSDQPGGARPDPSTFSVSDSVSSNSITGYVYNDRNGDKTYDDGEGLSAVVLSLNGVQSVLSDDKGYYQFLYLENGSYIVAEIDHPNANINLGSANTVSNIVLANNSKIVNFRNVLSNEKPVAKAQEVTTAEDTAKKITLAGSDPDKDSLSYVLLSGPDHGSVAGSGKDRTYTPNKNYVGDDSFTFTVNDGSENSNTAKVKIKVTAVNDIPVAIGQGVTTAEDTAKKITLSGSDPDKDSLSYVLLSGPDHGSLAGSGKSFIYTPNNNYVGDDSFTFKVNDGTADSDIATVKITVTALNDSPVAAKQNMTTPEDTPKSITLSGSDPDGDALSYILLSQPGYGTLAGTGNVLTYTPNENYVGDDSFTFKVNDGTEDSQTKTVIIIVTPINDAPEAVDDSVIVEQDSINNIIDVLNNDSDNDDDPLTVTSAKALLGIVVINEDGSLSYTAQQDYFGEDVIHYSIDDGNGGTGRAVIDVTITEKVQNLAPIAVDDTVNMPSTNTIVIDVLNNDSDPENNELTLVNVSSYFGEVAMVDNQLRFTPEQGVSGQFVIFYTIEDTAKNTASAQVNLTINDLGPVITLPHDLCGDYQVNANALYTRVDLGKASAIDRFGDTVPVSLVDGVSLFPPGLNEVTWHSTDAEGKTSVAIQKVCVMPLISLSKNQTVVEGVEINFSVHLNGDAPAYPVTVPYTVTGTADDGDHDLASGEVIIKDGTSAVLSVDIFEDSEVEMDETIIIDLSPELNAGDKAKHIITISELNIAPQVTLNPQQDNQSRLIITPDGGEVIIRAKVTDVNTIDSFIYHWQTDDDNVLNDSTNEDIFRFMPNDLAEGIYAISLTVSDSGEPVQRASTIVFLEVRDSLPKLDNADSDGDLIPDIAEGFGDSDRDGIPDYLDRIPECNVLQELAKESDVYLIEGQAGVCLRRGEFTLKGVTGGANITDNDVVKIEDDLIKDNEATNIGGIFDYIAYGLPVQGSSFAIVIPQRNPIPENAVYRKFNRANKWHTFEVDDAVEKPLNSLWSTQGEPGYCPPPSINNTQGTWVRGLIPGYWCVQMILVDGGIYDDDNKKNGIIVDPGYVGVMNINDQCN